MGERQGELRTIHLKNHLATAAMLTAEQNGGRAGGVGSDAATLDLANGSDTAVLTVRPGTRWRPIRRATGFSRRKRDRAPTVRAKGSARPNRQKSYSND